MAEQHAANGLLPTIRQVVRVDVKRLAVRQVAEQHAAVELRNRLVTVDDRAGHGNPVLSPLSAEQRIQMVELNHGVRHAGGGARVPQAHGARVMVVAVPRPAPGPEQVVPHPFCDRAPSGHETEAAFPVVPAQVRSRRRHADFLDRRLADVGDQQSAGACVPGQVLRIAQAVGPDLGQCVAVQGERIIRRHAVAAVGAVRSKRVDAENLPEHPAEVLRQVQRIPSTTAVAHAQVKQAEVGISRNRARIEGDLPAAVSPVWLFDAHQLPGRTAVVERGPRILRPPLQQHRVMRVLVMRVLAGCEVPPPPPVRRIHEGVEPAEPRSVRLGELRVEGEAVETQFPGGSCPVRAQIEPPARLPEIEP